MPDWLASPTLPSLSLPGGWWTLVGLGAAILLIAAVAFVRRLRRPATTTYVGEGQRGELLDARRGPFNTTGTQEGRHPSPPGLPPGEEARLRRVRAVADFLDNSLKIPGVGYPIGWDSVIGLVPGAGDAITGTLAVWIIVQGHQLGVPKRTLVRMCGNAGIDLAGGAVPGLGDAFDVIFKANRKNLRLIEKHLADPPADRRALR
ncbi:DUF4112 domain-containing protein [Alienimonas californiensis]|uniref:DUF4112 domain-containing protein n=1 Tax=Alienimonas californiensis TaxID=2527989 RepID=A0A517PAH1_9PLAN|nr:DUF4112 domain-containing protein [Alienimonas californiensis]QDT16366.1 hypothetical protein CA12_24670 [Alienimonas californiensis]